MEPVYGNHLGIVINKNDPEGRKRVQVFIPYLSCSLYKNWNESLNDIVIKSPNDLTPDVLEKLQAILPWAEASMPLFGGSTGATINTSTRKTSVNNSDSTLNITAANGINNGIDNYPANVSGATLTSTADGSNPGAASTPNSSSTPSNNVDFFNASVQSGNAYTFTGDSAIKIDANGTTSPQLEVGGQSSSTARFNGQVDALNVNYITTGSAPAGWYYASLNGGTPVLTYNNGVDTGAVAGVVESSPYLFTAMGGGMELNNGNDLITTGITDNSQLTLVPATNQNLPSIDSLTLNQYNQITGGQISAEQQQMLDGFANGTTSSIAGTSNSTTPTTTQIVNNNDHRNGSRARTDDSLITASGSPNGAFSVPNEGAKIWVFFYGGDTQKPVYFGAAVEPTV